MPPLVSTPCARRIRLPVWNDAESLRVSEDESLSERGGRGLEEILLGYEVLRIYLLEQGIDEERGRKSGILNGFLSTESSHHDPREQGVQCIFHFGSNSASIAHFAVASRKPPNEPSGSASRRSDPSPVVTDSKFSSWREISRFSREGRHGRRRWGLQGSRSHDEEHVAGRFGKVRGSYRPVTRFETAQDVGRLCGRD